MIGWAIRKWMAWRLQRRIAREEQERRRLQALIELVNRHIDEHSGLNSVVSGVLSNRPGAFVASDNHEAHVQAHVEALADADVIAVRTGWRRP